MFESPRQRFQKSEQLAAVHNVVVASAQFKTACDMAMLELVENLFSGSDPQNAIANAFRIDGAKIFLATLQTIGQPSTSKTTKIEDNLKHQ